MLRVLLFMLVPAFATVSANAAEKIRPATLTPQTVNDAQWSLAAGSRNGPILLKAQVLLDRARFSPGVIDARSGENFDKALRAFQQAHAVEPSGKLDQATWNALIDTSNEPALRDYTVTAADVEGPFVQSIPKDFEKMARLDRLAYRSASERLAEKFHLSEQLLAASNNGKDLRRVGTDIVVANVAPLDPRKPSRTSGREKRPATTGVASEPVKAARLEVDKTGRSVRVFGRGRELIAYYPATIGSTEKPAPSGSFEVRGIAYDPTYGYDPRYRFKGQWATRPVEVASGSNNPSDWFRSRYRPRAMEFTGLRSRKRSAKPNRMVASVSPTGMRSRWPSL